MLLLHGNAQLGVAHAHLPHASGELSCGAAQSIRLALIRIVDGLQLGMSISSVLFKWVAPSDRRDAHLGSLVESVQRARLDL